MTSLPTFQPRKREDHSLFSPDLEWLLALSQEGFSSIFRGSPVKRTKWRGMVRNACVAIGNSGLRPGDLRYTEVCARLVQLAASADTNLSEHAQWALGRLGFSESIPHISGFV